MFWWVCVLSAWAVVIGAAERTLALARRTGLHEASIRSETGDLWDDLPGVEVVDGPDIPLLADWYPDHRLTAAHQRLTELFRKRRRNRSSVEKLSPAKRRQHRVAGRRKLRRAALSPPS
jgi:hypothetical protein